MKLPLSRSQNLLTLSSVEDDGLGEELQVVWEMRAEVGIQEQVGLLIAPRVARRPRILSSVRVPE